MSDEIINEDNEEWDKLSEFEKKMFVNTHLRATLEYMNNQNPDPFTKYLIDEGIKHLENKKNCIERTVNDE